MKKTEQTHEKDAAASSEDLAAIEHTIEKAEEVYTAQAAELEHIEEPASTSEASMDSDPASMERLYSVPVEVTVVVGSARMTLGDLARIQPGSLLELDREAHEPADIVVNGRTVARGEVVTVGDRYGVRITAVIETAPDA